MSKIVLFFVSLTLITAPLFASGSTKDKYSMFPEAKDGYVRYIVDVPKTANDYDHKVELLIGKNMLVDCNAASFSATIKSVALKGWGYHYLEVSDIQQNPTTRMACTKQKFARFVSVYDRKQTLRRYNSRLGTVIYVPEGYSVRYRIWSATPSTKKASRR